MVNRILIRIKVVQMLYAYLLTRTEFKIETEPDTSTADKKFAHVAYVDFLVLLLEVTGNSPYCKAKGRVAVDKKLQLSAVGKALAADSTLKHLALKGGNESIWPIELVEELRNQLTDTAAWNDYKRKRKADLGDEVEMWCALFETLFARNADIMAVMRRQNGFTNQGFGLAIEKVIATLRSFYGTRASYYAAIKGLEASLTAAHKMYISMFALIVRLTDARERQLDTAKHKFLATADDKNPNMRFVNNQLAQSLRDNKQLEEYIKDYGIGWIDNYELLDNLLKSITASQLYRDYMESSANDWESDCEFWRQVLRQIVFVSDDLVEAIEKESVYWNDDLHIIGTFVLKTIRSAAVDSSRTISFLPQYKDEEDSHFGVSLFELAVTHRQEYTDYVMKFVNTENWDTERIAFMDVVLMLCAVTEIINFPNIPLAVTLNEYIDIANTYSTAKSGQFINGVLYSVVTYLKENNIIFK
ncbi:MAG: transcription antitermination protein NusB [Muribaculaceae bacterium]|nr:transcription antitermination protein NusB [Muribaculaceae bacterium]